MDGGYGIGSHRPGERQEVPGWDGMRWDDGDGERMYVCKYIWKEGARGERGALERGLGAASASSSAIGSPSTTSVMGGWD